MGSYNFAASSPLPHHTTDQNKKNKLYFDKISPHDFYFLAFLVNPYLYILHYVVVFHGYGGRMTVADCERSPVSKIIKDAFDEVGVKKKDVNGRSQFGQ